MAISDETARLYGEDILLQEGAIACPRCSSEGLTFNDVFNLAGNKLTVYVKCPKCGLSWEQIWVTEWSLVDVRNFTEAA